MASCLFCSSALSPTPKHKKILLLSGYRNYGFIGCEYCLRISTGPGHTGQVLHCWNKIDEIWPGRFHFPIVPGQILYVLGQYAFSPVLAPRQHSPVKRLWYITFGQILYLLVALLLCILHISEFCRTRFSCSKEAVAKIDEPLVYGVVSHYACSQVGFLKPWWKETTLHKHPLCWDKHVMLLISIVSIVTLAPTSFLCRDNILNSPLPPKASKFGRTLLLLVLVLESLSSCNSFPNDLFVFAMAANCQRSSISLLPVLMNQSYIN